MNVPLLAASGICFERDGRTLIDEVSIEVHEGEIICLLGQSGAGKTTFLNVLAGWLHESRGTIRRNYLRAGYLEQSESLIPWLTLRDNALLGPRLLGEADIERQLEIDDLLHLLGLSAHAHKKAAALSGGMRRRAELASVLASHPDLLLLDEPTTGLDLVTQELVHDHLTRYVCERKAGAIVVTHSIEEAIRLSSRVCILSGSPFRLMEVGSGKDYSEISGACKALWCKEMFFRCAA